MDKRIIETVALNDFSFHIAITCTPAGTIIIKPFRITVEIVLKSYKADILTVSHTLIFPEWHSRSDAVIKNRRGANPIKCIHNQNIAFTIALKSYRKSFTCKTLTSSIQSCNFETINCVILIKIDNENRIFNYHTIVKTIVIQTFINFIFLRLCSWLK